MRSRVPGISPAKIAIAEQVTMAPIAETGDMKKVIGTRSAVAMVAVRPGTAPTNKPNRAASTMVTSTSGWKTISAASRIPVKESPSPRRNIAPRKRNAQQAVEAIMHHHGDSDRQDRHQHRTDAKHGEQHRERYERRRDESQRRRSQDVEHHQRYRDRQRPQMMPGPCPRRQRNSTRFRPLPQAARYQDDRAEPERYGNPGREHRCPVFLTRYGWEGSGIEPDHEGEDQQ